MSTVLLSRQRSRLLSAALLAAMTIATGVGLMSTSGWLIARAAEHPDASALTLAAVCVRALGLSRGLLRYGERLTGHDAVLHWVADVRIEVFERLRRQPKARTADALSALGRDVEGLQELWLRGIVPWAAAVVVALGAAAVALLALPEAGLVLAVGLVTAVVVVPGFAWIAGSALEHLAAVRARHQGAVIDLLHGSVDLLTCGGTAGALEMVECSAAELDRYARAVGRRTALLSGVIVLAQGLTTIGVVWLGWRAVAFSELPRVWLVVLALGAYAAFESATGLVDAATAVRTGRGAVRRVAALDAPLDALLLGEAEASPTVGGPLVVARDLGLVRPGRPRPAVHGVDLELSAGRTVGVVGGSGAGKSSLLLLLAGLEAATSGTVLVGGRPAHLLTQQARPDAVVLVEQDAHVFDASLRDNLLIGRPSAEEEQLHEVLHIVGLTPWVRSLPAGLATPLGHRGTRLSGGQRRRLAVARALLSPAPVLLLDEPTEGLAPDEADRLLADALAAAHDRAVVVVTHRLAALERVDHVLVLERGQVVASGTLEAVRRLPGLVREAWLGQVCLI